MISIKKDTKEVVCTTKIDGLYTERQEWQDELELIVHPFTATIEERDNHTRTHIQWKELGPADRNSAEYKIMNMLEKTHLI